MTQWPGNLSAQLLWRNDLQISTLWRNDLGICQRNSMSQLSRNLSTNYRTHLTWESASSIFWRNDLEICQMKYLTQWPGHLSAQQLYYTMTWESVSSTLVTQWPGNLSAQLYDAITFESVSSRMLSPGRTTLSTATATMITHSTPTFRKSKNLLTWTSSSIGSTLHFKTFKISCRARLFYNMRPLLILQELVAWRYASVIVSIWNWILQR